ncbi:MAG: ubiquitin-like small modifier protein 1 [Thermoplasmatota archaeon]
MALTIRLPNSLRTYAQGQPTVDVPAATVGDAIDRLVQTYPELRAQILDGGGELRSYVNLFLNGIDIRQLRAGATPVGPGDVLLLLPAVAGGSHDSP